MTGLYLTIDDSPSANFLQLCAFLKERDIPALFFCRGDLISLYKDEVLQAIKDGFVIANHSWSHHWASKLGADMAIAEIIKTQNLIDELYARAGVKQMIKSMRFPHMDSGLGNWPLPPDQFSTEEQDDVRRVYATFYNNDMDEPSMAQIALHDEIEESLKAHNFQQINFDNIDVNWFKTYTQSSAVSTQGTFCHPDWHLFKRHAHRGQSVESLNKNFDDFVVRYPQSNQILVMHDSVELWPYTQELIDHMLERGHKFLPIPN